MYDISSTQIDKKIIHRIGNKFREELLVFSDELTPNIEEIDNLLLQNYLKPILNYNEIYELYHESNINLNEINYFSNKIFENDDNFIEISKDIAKALYSCLICAELAGDFHLGYARQLTDKSSLLFDLAF